MTGATTEPAIDCHAHVIDPARFAYGEGPGYRPEAGEIGTADAFAAVLDAAGVGHALLVQPSCYATDNAAILDAMARHPGRFKAIAVLDPATPDRVLEALGACGVVGVRFNLPYDPEALMRPGVETYLARLRALGWLVQVHGDDAHLAAAAPILRRSGVRLVIDHFGAGELAGGLAQPGFRAVLALGRESQAVVKLSAPFRASRRAPSYDDLDPLVAALVADFGVERCVWGSDWPFINCARRPDYGADLAALRRWLPDAEERHAVLWDNPKRLFGF